MMEQEKRLEIAKIYNPCGQPSLEFFLPDESSQVPAVEVESSTSSLDFSVDTHKPLDNSEGIYADSQHYVDPTGSGQDNNLTEGRRVKAHFDVLKPHLKACNNKVK
ncbi:uncharacterized protein [Spinacia oleracea]|uniref:Uncharacterized protein isoform X2 n=1 Tax=Spinacia oleracea TaxID=3562 RepID=A0ABM3RBV7_SPIOL|nr:uncharacterized protein LOC110776681 isoform X2 [Spinacia oleracea]